MLCAYIRSSSYVNYKFCEMQYFLTYVLGHRSDSGKRAELGTMVHKVMEVLANLKKFEQDNPKRKTLEHTDEVTGKIRIKKEELYTDEFLRRLEDISYEEYKKDSKQKWWPRDRREITELVDVVMNHANGEFDPRKRDVLYPEPHFDLTIDEPWAKFDFEDANGQRCTGQLAIKGTIDLITKVDEDTLEVIDWKGLPLHTLLPTPNGFTTMGHIQEGDIVFDQFGKQCKVVGKSQVKVKDCYTITFDDTTQVTCDDEHLWKLSDGRTVPIQELSIGDKINVTKSIECDDIDLPIDPYVLGIWLGDGRNRSFEITSADKFVFGEIKYRGYELGKDTENRSDNLINKTVLKSTHKLRELGLLHNKHIPEIYLRASYQQRLDLLRGLMDSDGNVNKVRKQAVFTSCNQVLSEDVKQLLLTLGQRPNLSSIKRDTNFKKDVEIFPVHFRCIDGLNPFLLPRKADQIDPSWGNGRSDVRRIVKIEKSITQKTQCISVDSPDHTYLCTENFIPTHNTGQRKDWTTMQEKDYKYLQTDPQLLLYYYAISRLYPEFKNVIMTIYFIRPDQGGPFTLFYDDSDKEKFIAMLKDRFQDITANQTPRPLDPRRKHFKCQRMCHFYKNNWPGTDCNMCQYAEDYLKKHGMDKTVQDLTNPGFSVGYYESPG